jgi:hypothetical protein
VIVFGNGSEIDHANLLRVGYVILPQSTVEEMWTSGREAISEIISASLGPSLAAPLQGLVSILEAAAGVAPGLWPPTPGVLAFPAAEGHWVIDLHGASQRLIADLRYPSVTGAIANVRAKSFEDLTQEMIDRSGWQPPPPIRDLVGRHLRTVPGGRDFGEIDAIAVGGGIALVVSCKSVIYSDEYDRGEYSAVRNVRSMVEEACRNLESFVGTLSEVPNGANYDLSQVERVLGIVLTATPVYLVPPLLDEEILPGLRKVATFEGLDHRPRRGGSRLTQGFRLRALRALRPNRPRPSR